MLFGDGVEVPDEELLLRDPVFFDIDEESFESVTRLVTELSVTRLTEVFELFPVSFPAVPLLVVLSRRRPGHRITTCDAHDCLPVPVGPGAPHRNVVVPPILICFSAGSDVWQTMWPRAGPSGRRGGVTRHGAVDLSAVGVHDPV
jgi:hypothetical protein